MIQKTRQLFATQEEAENETYWHHQLRGVLPSLTLPTDFPRRMGQSHNRASLSVELAGSIKEELKALGQQRDCTLFMILLAAYQVLLSRYTEQKDILVGSPGTNCKGLFGSYACPLILRTDLSGNPRFLDLLAQVRRVTLEAHAHQPIPVEFLLEKMQVESDGTYAPLFQILFALEEASVESLEGDCTVQERALNWGQDRLDLSLNLTETPSGLLTS